MKTLISIIAFLAFCVFISNKAYTQTNTENKEKNKTEEVKEVPAKGEKSKEKPAPAPEPVAEPSESPAPPPVNTRGMSDPIPGAEIFIEQEPTYESKAKESSGTESGKKNKKKN